MASCRKTGDFCDRRCYTATVDQFGFDCTRFFPRIERKAKPAGRGKVRDLGWAYDIVTAHWLSLVQLAVEPSYSSRISLGSYTMLKYLEA